MTVGICVGNNVGPVGLTVGDVIGAAVPVAL
jgi:hypothetical protein